MGNERRDQSKGGHTRIRTCQNLMEHKEVILFYFRSNVGRTLNHRRPLGCHRCHFESEVWGEICCATEDISYGTEVNFLAIGAIDKLMHDGGNEDQLRYIVPAISRHMMTK